MSEKEISEKMQDIMKRMKPDAKSLICHIRLYPKKLASVNLRFKDTKLDI